MQYSFLMKDGSLIQLSLDRFPLNKPENKLTVLDQEFLKKLLDLRESLYLGEVHKPNYRSNPFDTKGITSAKDLEGFFYNNSIIKSLYQLSELFLLIPPSIEQIPPDEKSFYVFKPPAPNSSEIAETILPLLKNTTDINELDLKEKSPISSTAYRVKSVDSYIRKLIKTIRNHKLDVIPELLLLLQLAIEYAESESDIKTNPNDKIFKQESLIKYRRVINKRNDIATTINQFILDELGIRKLTYLRNRHINDDYTGKTEYTSYLNLVQPMIIELIKISSELNIKSNNPDLEEKQSALIKAIDQNLNRIVANSELMKLSHKEFLKNVFEVDFELAQDKRSLDQILVYKYESMTSQELREYANSSKNIEEYEYNALNILANIKDNPDLKLTSIVSYYAFPNDNDYTGFQIRYQRKLDNNRQQNEEIQIQDLISYYRAIFGKAKHKNNYTKNMIQKNLEFLKDYFTLLQTSYILGERYEKLPKQILIEMLALKPSLVNRIADKYD